MQTQYKIIQNQFAIFKPDGDIVLDTISISSSLAINKFEKFGNDWLKSRKSGFNVKQIDLEIITK